MKKQSIWVFQWRKSVHYWWSYILFSPECKELTSMLDPLLYRWGVPPVVIRCMHWTMQMWVLQTWIKALGLNIVMYHEIWILLNIFLYETIELFILWHVWRYSGVLWVNSCPPLTRLHQRQSCMSGQALLHHWLCNQKHPWGICSCSPIVNFLKVTFYHEMVSLVIFLIKKSSK